MSEYVTGTDIQITLTFTDVDGVAVDPDTVSAYVKNPSGAVASFEYLTDDELSKSSTGVYVLVYSLAIDAMTGWYSYGGRGAGTYNATAKNGKFRANDWPYD